ncbi:MAG TPA: putative Ig domain-containing protein, partial [Pseudonocardiaceae bacterium]
SGTTNLTITATNTAGTTTQALSIIAGQAPTITSATAASFSTGTASTFAITATGYPAPTITEAGTLPAGLTFVDNTNGTATIAGTPTAGGTYVLAITATNRTGSANQTLTITVGQAPKITSASTVTATAGKTFTFTVTTTGYPQPKVSKTGSFPLGVLFTANSNGTATIFGTPLTNGVYPVTITATSTAGTATQLFSVVVNQAPAITSAGTAKFSTGTAGSFTIATTGYPPSAIGESGAVPAALSFVDNKNGTATIAGTPAATAGGSYVLTVTATNSAGSTAQRFTITVTQPPMITSASTLNVGLYKSFSFTVTTTGYPKPTLSKTGSLPWGVQFTANNSATATISGIPFTSGSYRLTITATSTTGTTNQSFTMTVR